MHNALIDALLDTSLYPHIVDRCELIETHISWVILAGEYAYKIKKPVNFGFLDFSTLAKRHFYCQEELRLNRRLAADLYLDVVAISGSLQQPRLSAEGPIIEYMVKMQRFDQLAQFDRMLESGLLHATHIDATASMVAAFHQQVDHADTNSTFGSAEQVIAPVRENFSQIRNCSESNSFLPQLVSIEDWCQQHYSVLQPVLAQRQQNGFIRECHGDLHLRNLAWINHKPVAFDCIEFNPNLRWIDVISDVAFLVMDLQEKNQPAYSQRFLNAYLQLSGDYAGLQVLRFYLVYRALVRAKVDAIRLSQEDLSPQERVEDKVDFSHYLALAEKYSQPKTPQLIITHGMSASGKSTVTQQLLEQIGAIRIRSDIERKRLFGQAPDSNQQQGLEKGLYSEPVSQRTYNALAELVRVITSAGYPVIVDATFLKTSQRQQFRLLAKTCAVPFVILSFSALPDTLRRRIVEREQGISDADLAVLEHQLKKWQPLAQSEQDHVIEIDTDKPVNIATLQTKINAYV